MKYARGSFIVVPSREKLRGMPVPAQALYMWLCAYANETGDCYPSRSTLAKDCDCSLSTIDRMTQLLVDRELLKVEKRVKNGENMTNLYSVVIWGGSFTDRQPSFTDRQRVASQTDKELNPILTESTISETKFRTVSENEEEIPKPRSRAKYPHSKEVFSWFPKPQASWKLNTTELQYAECLWERGEVEVKKRLSYLARHDGEEFLPKINKPSDLEKKWLDLSDHAKRNR